MRVVTGQSQTGTRYWQFVPTSLLVVSSLLIAALPGRTVTTLQNPSNSSLLAQADVTREADRLLQQGRQQSNLGRHEAAIQTLEQALKAYRSRSNRNGEAQVLNSLGVNYDAISQPAKAVELYQQALAIFQQVQDRPGQAKVLHNMGIAYLSLTQYEQGITFLQQAIAIYAELKQPDEAADSYMMLGTAYNYLGKYNNAINYFQQALAILPKGKDATQQRSQRKKQALMLLGIAGAQLGLGDGSKAEETIAQAEAIGNAISDAEVAKLVLLLRETAKQPDVRTAQTNPQKRAADELLNQGTRQWQANQYSTAIATLNQALNLYRSVGDRSGEAKALNNLGIAHQSLSQYGAAIAYYQQASSLFRQLQDRLGEATVLLQFGAAYSDLAQYDKAIDLFQQALVSFRQSGSVTEQRPRRESEAKALTNLGTAYQASARSEQALPFYQQALPIYREVRDPRGEARARNGLGNAYLALAKVDQAVEQFSQALTLFRQVGDRNGKALALNNLGLIYDARSQYAKAIETYQQALALNRQVGDQANQGTTLNNLGVTLFKTGDLAAAEASLTQAVTTWESLRPGLTDENKVSLFDRQVRTYQTLQQVLVAQGKLDPALEVAERGRARAFAELLARRLNPQSDTKNQTDIKPPTIAQIRQIARAQNATLVQYSVINNAAWKDGKATKEAALYIWVIQPSGEIAFRSVPLQPDRSTAQVALASTPNRGLTSASNSLAALVNESRRSIGVRPTEPNSPSSAIAFTPDIAEANIQLRRLHQVLIQPIANLLPTNPNQRVVFIPQGSLFLVPFPALLNANGKALIENHTILTAPSIQVLALTGRERQGAGNRKLEAGNALIVGNPTMPKVAPAPGVPPQPLPPLPGAEAEAEEIAEVLRASVLTGDRATRATVVQKMPNASIVHLATHGLLDDDRGLGSAIALAPSGNDNGFLTAEDILNMRLNAQLVVLSACNTGRGRVTGDGVIGLSRSLISAGVPSVIVSLWAVPDASTARLMTEFYRNLQKSPDKAQALRQAMLTTKQTYKNPIDWAAFTLIGEAE